MEGTGWLDARKNAWPTHGSGSGLADRGFVGCSFLVALHFSLCRSWLDISICAGFGLRLRLWRRGLRFRRSCERIRPGAATSFPAAFPAAFASSATPIVIAATAATVALGALLSHELVKLSLLEHLPKGADCKAEHCHGGAQIEGFLERPSGPHLVVAQSDPEAATLSVSGAAATSGSTTALAAAFTWSALLAGIAVGISHGLGPGLRRKCDASPQTREFCGELRQLFQQLS